MKAEHRKELETNILAQQLGRAYEGLKTGPSRMTLIYVGGAVAVVLIIVLFRYFMSTSEATSSERWTKLDEVLFPEQLNSFLKEPDLKGTPQERLARFKEARAQFALGLRQLGDTRDLGLSNIKDATELYEKLSQDAGRVPLLHQEAIWGTAKGNETLGDYEKARKMYRKLVQEYPASALGKDAQTQLDRLENKANEPDLAALKKAYGPTSSGKSE